MLRDFVIIIGFSVYLYRLRRLILLWQRTGPQKPYVMFMAAIISMKPQRVIFPASIRTVICTLFYELYLSLPLLMVRVPCSGISGSPVRRNIDQIFSHLPYICIHDFSRKLVCAGSHGKFKRRIQLHTIPGCKVYCSQSTGSKAFHCIIYNLSLLNVPVHTFIIALSNSL